MLNWVCRLCCNDGSEPTNDAMLLFVAPLFVALSTGRAAPRVSRAPQLRSLRTASVYLMASWQAADLKVKGAKLPNEVEELLSADTDRQTTEKMWAAFRSCYASEDAAIAAAMRNTGAILPYLNRPSNIYGTYKYLESELGTEGARDVITKNPGVLSCSPAAIAQTPIEDVVKAADAVGLIDSLPIPPVVRNNADKLIFIVGASLVYQRLQACAGASCGIE